MSSMISLRSVRKSYDGGQTYAVDGVDLEVGEGELVVLLGESGCGKTTTLKMINRLIERSDGSIEIDGEDNASGDPTELRRHIGYVFQGVGLFPHLTVGENIGITPKLLGWEDHEIRERVDELLELVSLPPDEYRDRQTRDLSGGQQQRVGLARALAARPRIMLMDEPFGALDPLTREGLQEEFKNIHGNLGLTTIMVTHDMTEALLMADRIGAMKDGKMLQVASPREMISGQGDAYVRKLMDMPKRQADRVEALIHEGGQGHA